MSDFIRPLLICNKILLQSRKRILFKSALSGHLKATGSNPSVYIKSVQRCSYSGLNNTLTLCGFN